MRSENQATTQVNASEDSLNRCNAGVRQGFRLRERAPYSRTVLESTGCCAALNGRNPHGPIKAVAEILNLL